MPSASEPLRNLMIKWFDTLLDGSPYQFLISRGYTEKSGMIYPPVKHHMPNREEYACLRFLVDEWDYDFELASFWSENP